MAENAVRIKTDPDPYEAFRLAQAYRVGDLIFVSGQAAIDLDGNVVGAGDFDAQAEQTFSNLAAVLEAGGSSLAKIVKVNIYLKDMGNFGRSWTCARNTSRRPIRPTPSSRSRASRCRNWKSRSRRSPWSKARSWTHRAGTPPAISETYGAAKKSILEVIALLAIGFQHGVSTKGRKADRKGLKRGTID